MLTLGYVDGVAGKASSLPDEGARLGEEPGNLSAHELVAGRLLAVGVNLACVAHIPRPHGGAVVVGLGLARGGELGALAVKGVAVLVLGAADGLVGGEGVDHEGGVVGPINVGVYTQAKEVLMIVGIDARVDLCAPAVGVLALSNGVGVEDTGELNLGLDGAVLVEDPLDGVLVVGGGEDLLDDELAGAGDNGGVVAEVGVLEEQAVVLLVDANGVLDEADAAVLGGELGVEVADEALAVAAEFEAVGHVAGAVLA